MFVRYLLFYYVAAYLDLFHCLHVYLLLLFSITLASLQINYCHNIEDCFGDMLSPKRTAVNKTIASLNLQICKSSYLQCKLVRHLFI